MESTEQTSGLLHQILPPRIEDAGLEDCALPPESIHQAFLKAASAVNHIFSDDDDAACVNDPCPGEDASDDILAGIEPENKPPPGPCGVVRGVEGGGDEVVVSGTGAGEEVADEVVVIGEEGGGGGGKLGDGGEACVDELRGLGIKDDDGKNGVVLDGEDEEEKKPTLAEGFV